MYLLTYYFHRQPRWGALTVKCVAGDCGGRVKPGRDGPGFARSAGGSAPCSGPGNRGTSTGANAAGRVGLKGLSAPRHPHGRARPGQRSPRRGRRVGCFLPDYIFAAAWRLRSHPLKPAGGSPGGAHNFALTYMVNSMPKDDIAELIPAPSRRLMSLVRLFKLRSRHQPVEELAVDRRCGSRPCRRPDSCKAARCRRMKACQLAIEAGWPWAIAGVEVGTEQYWRALWERCEGLRRKRAG